MNWSNQTWKITVTFTLLLLLAALPLSACRNEATPQPEEPTPQPMETETKALVKRYYEEVWNQGNLALLDDLVGEDFVDGHTCVAYQANRGGLKQLIAGVRDSFLDTRISVEKIIAEGDMVGVLWTFDATFAPSGERITFTGNELWRVADGKMVERWGEFDAAGMLTQIGVIRPRDPQFPLGATTSGGTPATEKDVALIERYYESVWNQGELAAIDSLFAADFVDHTPDPGQSPDLRGFKQSIAGFGTGFSELNFRIDELVAQEEVVKASLTVSAVFKPTGRRVEFTGVELWRVQEGKIIERWGEFNAVDMVIDHGMLPEPPK